MAKISIFNSPFKPQAISKQNANSAGWADPYVPNKKPANWIECPICKAKIKRLQSHLNKVHKENIEKE